MCHTMCHTCVLILRASLACGALFLHQNCAVSRSKRRKPRSFRVEIFENRCARSRKRTQNAGKTLEQSFHACCAGRAGCPELSSVFYTQICGKTSRFSPEIAEISMKFDALFAPHTRPAPAKNAQTSQEYATQCAAHVY